MPDKNNQNDSPSEEKIVQDLRRERASTTSKDDEIEQGGETGQEISQENKGDDSVDWSMTMVINILADALDYIVGFIPVLGDILDAAIAGYNTLRSWGADPSARVKAIIATAVVPFIIEVFGVLVAPIVNDLLPSFIVGSLIGRIIIKKAMKKAGLKDNT